MAFKNGRSFVIVAVCVILQGLYSNGQGTTGIRNSLLESLRIFKGFKTLMSEDGITKIKDILVPIVQPQIVGLHIPNVVRNVRSHGDLRYLNAPMSVKRRSEGTYSGDTITLISSTS
jgi:hypothetical protein